jgi:hypothetical protein
MSSNLSTALPVEVLAHLLGWTTEAHWLHLRLLSRNWFSAVVCLMELELTAQTSDGAWKPQLKRTISHRLLPVSSSFMSPEVHQSVCAAHFSGGCGTVSERDLMLIASHFPRLEQLSCRGTVTDTVLRKIEEHARLKSLDLLEGKCVTDLGLRELSKLPSLTSLTVVEGLADYRRQSGCVIEALHSENPSLRRVRRDHGRWVG